MKIVKIDDLEILLDDEDYEKVRSLDLRINISRGKPHPQFYYYGKLKFVSKLIINNFKNRIIYRDKNTLNLQKSNLEVQTKERKEKQKSNYYQKNKQHHLEYTKKWQQDPKNKEKLLKRQRKYRKESTGLSANRKYQNKNRDKITAYSKTPKARYSNLVKRHQNKNWNLNNIISLEEYTLLSSYPCFYCENSIHTVSGAGIDRIDNDLGYIVNNVLPCCGDCNVLRSNLLTVNETKELIKLLQQLRGKKNIWS